MDAEVRVELDVCGKVTPCREDSVNHDKRGGVPGVGGETLSGSEQRGRKGM